MWTSPLPQLLRAPVPAVAGGYRLWRRHGARIRRARWLCQCADGMRLRRVPNWEQRSLRLYRRAATSLQGLAGADLESGAGAGEAAAGAEGQSGAAPDWARRAHRALRLVEEPYGRSALGLGVLGGALVAGALLILLVGSALSPALRQRLFPRDLARGRPWTASSAEPGNELSGLGPSSRRTHFFHTRFSSHPSVEIDLGEVHLIRSLLIKNREDCCQERALPLNVEIFDGHDWQLIAQRRAPFSVWQHDVEPVRAQLVRVRLAGTGFLHLKKIAIYGQ
jgi:hypothetical protein